MGRGGRWPCAVLYGAYDTNTVVTLEEVNGTVKQFFGLSYAMVFRVSVYACIISILLLGLSFVISPVKDLAVNKAWAVRIALIVILIFGLAGILQTAIDVSI